MIKIKVLGVILAGIFAILGLLHIYWAVGGSGTFDAVIPTINGKAAIHPTPFLTILVALALFMAMLTILGQVGFLGNLIPKRLFFVGTLFIAILFFLRAVGEFRLVGFFKKVTDTTFAYWDTWLFSPLCIVISVISVLLLIYEEKS